MRNWIVIALALSAQLASSQTRTLVEPLDFQDETNNLTLMSTIEQIAWDGEAIVIRGDVSHLLRIDRTGRLLGTIAIEEGSDVYRTPIGFATHEGTTAMINASGHLFVLDREGALTVHRSSWFSPEASFPYFNTMVFAFDGTRLVLPALPETGKANVVVTPATGEVVLMDERPEMRVPNPRWGMAADLWSFDGERYYSLGKFRPVLRVYDARLELIAEHALMSPEIAEAERRLYEPTEEESRRLRVTPPHFTDLEARDGKVFALGAGTLLEIEGSSGQVRHRYQFHGKGEDFAGVDPARPLYFQSFALLDDNTVILAHPGLMWNHDLWSAVLDRNPNG